MSQLHPYITRDRSRKVDVLGGCVVQRCTLKHDTDSTANTPTTEASVFNILQQLSKSANSMDAIHGSPLSIENVPRLRHDNDHDDITKIKLLPTTDEIICLKPPFMPRKTAGLDSQQLLDVHFRQLRYDSTEELIDACYDGFQQAVWPHDPTQFRFETLRGTRYSLFSRVAFKACQYHQFDGALFRLSFECPPPLRRFALLNSDIFQPGMLCSLLAIHKETSEINVIHFEVKERQPSNLDASGTDDRAFIRVAIADKNDVLKVQEATYYARGLIEADLFLVHLPNILLAGFVPALRRLQEWYRRGTFPFAETIAAPSGATKALLTPPRYALETGFKYNYSCLKIDSAVVPEDEMTFEPMQNGKIDEKVLQSLKQNTTLDDGQATALYENLSRNLALCQGPPGTGKTFLGVAEAKVILNSRLLSNKDAQVKPIVVICMTNHALDDFLESLISNGIEKVVRLGSKISERDRHMIKNFNKENKALGSLGTEWAEELSGTPSFRILRDHLATHEPDVLAEFERLDTSTDSSSGLNHLKKSSAGLAFDYWLRGGDLKGLASLLKEGLTDELSSLSLSQGTGSKSQVDRTPTKQDEIEISFKRADSTRDESLCLQSLQKALEEFSRRCEANKNTHKLWLLSLSDREALVASWVKELDEFALCDAFADIHHRHQTLQQYRWDHINVSDAQRILEVGTQIVALTASGASSRWQFLNALNPEICIIEEASELSEPVTIAGLVPSLQHIIKIGDPLQLRPHIQTQVLCAERDPRYRLDESLFERLMHSIPYSKLNMQRRAHPDMANLLRAGCYPFLVDHTKTLSYPTIPGFQHRMFWLDHTRVEDHPDPGSALAKSFSNKYEARFIVEAIKYLVQHQGVSMKQITVLTPYNGQVAQIAKNLHGFCNVLLSDSDRESLMAMGVLSETDVLLDPSSNKNVPLSSLIRVTTIDNYQGEENDIIFLSTVRSNRDGKLGFLANQNRINVAISRARHAFYIVGNASMLLGRGTGWDSVIKVFRTQERIGACIPVSPCPKHVMEAHITVDIDTPTNFQALPRCQAPCDTILPCGHQCSATCHADEMHDDGRLKCSQPCSKTLPCGHPCGNLCHEKCGPCKVPKESVVLDCGHKTQLPCGGDVAKLECKTVVLAYPGVCGHVRIKYCSAGMAPCHEQCTRSYPCGHECKNPCSTCEHTECEETCGKKLPCGHKCLAPCHHRSKEACPPCQQTCRKRCAHGRCNLTCSEPCKPCTKTALADHCTHQDPALLCCLPGSRIPCSEPCTLPAPCGLHPCQGLCGEDCPEICDLCEGKPRRDALIALPCKCFFDVAELDVTFQMERVYDMEGITITRINVTSMPDEDCLKCPSCEGSVTGSKRYALCQQINDHNDLMGGLLMPLGRRLWGLMCAINQAQMDLRHDLSKSCNNIRPGPLAIRNNQDTITEALASIHSIKREAERFRVEIQTIQNAILTYSASLSPARMQVVVDGLPLATPQLPYLLRVERVIIRCDVIMFKYLLDVFTSVKSRGPLDNHLTVFLQVMQSNMQATLDSHVQGLPKLQSQCQAMQLKRLEAEFLLQRVCIIGLIRRLGSQTESTTSHFERAIELCKSHQSAAQLRYLVAQADRMIKEGTESIKLDDALSGPKDTLQGIAQSFWRKLGVFEPGKLITCASGHFYCSATFSHCPECG